MKIGFKQAIIALMTISLVVAFSFLGFQVYNSIMDAGENIDNFTNENLSIDEKDIERATKSTIDELNISNKGLLEKYEEIKTLLENYNLDDLKFGETETYFKETIKDMIDYEGLAEDISIQYNEEGKIIGFSYIEEEGVVSFNITENGIEAPIVINNIDLSSLSNEFLNKNNLEMLEEKIVNVIGSENINTNNPNFEFQYSDEDSKTLTGFSFQDENGRTQFAEVNFSNEGNTMEFTIKNSIEWSSDFSQENLQLTFEDSLEKEILESGIQNLDENKPLTFQYDGDGRLQSFSYMNDSEELVEVEFSTDKNNPSFTIGSVNFDFDFPTNQADLASTPEDALEAMIKSNLGNEIPENAEITIKYEDGKVSGFSYKDAEGVPQESSVVINGNEIHFNSNSAETKTVSTPYEINEGNIETIQRTNLTESIKKYIGSGDISATKSDIELLENEVTGEVVGFKYADENGRNHTVSITKTEDGFTFQEPEGTDSDLYKRDFTTEESQAFENLNTLAQERKALINAFEEAGVPIPEGTENFDIYLNEVREKALLDFTRKLYGTSETQQPTETQIKNADIIFTNIEKNLILDKNGEYSYTPTDVHENINSAIANSTPKDYTSDYFKGNEDFEKLSEAEQEISLDILNGKLKLGSFLEEGALLKESLFSNIVEYKKLFLIALAITAAGGGILAVNSKQKSKDEDGHVSENRYSSKFAQRIEERGGMSRKEISEPLNLIDKNSIGKAIISQ